LNGWDPVAVVGAGPGGLGVAAELHRRGIPVCVLERDGDVGAHWRRQYDRLSLNTARWSAHLPGERIPRRAGYWPSRDDYVAYLERYVGKRNLDLRLGIEVERIDRRGGGWTLGTSAGEVVAREVIVATGSCNTPLVPAWPGKESFRGQILHSCEYGGAGALAGEEVLVVGAGNSGAEIATDLAESGAAKVWLSVRTPPNLLPRWAFLLPPELFSRFVEAIPEKLVDGALFGLRRLLVGDLTRYGLGVPERGFYRTLLSARVTPIVDIGLVGALKRGAVEVVAALETFDGEDVLLADGRRLRPGTVIAATGYNRDLEQLVGHLGVLDEQGMPLANAAAPPVLPGLHFLGFAHVSGSSLRELRIGARGLAKAIARGRRDQT
jgi:putative flavoprotein involved in K+ transport